MNEIPQNEWKNLRKETAQEVIELLRGKGLTYTQAKNVLVYVRVFFENMELQLLKDTPL